MTTKTSKTTNTQVDVGYETSKFAMGVGMTMATLVGLWGTVCLVNALVGDGPVNLVKNYLSAIAGF